MKITECLNAEHGVFLTQLSFLEDMLNSGASSQELRAVVLAIARAVERHRDVEEKILYPAIRREFGEEFCPIQVMEFEHGEIEQLMQNIDRGSQNISELVGVFMKLLRQHIVKEIQVLFPMAELRISAEELEKMACQCIEHYHESAGGYMGEDAV